MARTVNFDFATAGVASEGRLTMAGTYMTTIGTTINLPPIEQRYLVNGLASIENVIPTPPEADGWRYQVKLETTDGQAHWWIVEVSDLTTPVDFSTLPVIEAISMPIDRTGTMIETWMNSVRAQAAAANANAISALGLGDSNAAESGQIWDSLGVTNSNVSGLGVRLDQADLDLAQHNDRIAANEVDMDILKNTTLPALQSELDAAEVDLATLRDVTMPQLQANLDSVELDMATLNNTTLPNLQTDLGAAQSELDTLTGTTIPALQDEMGAAQADLSTLDGRLGVAEADIISSGDALDARIDAAFLEIDSAQGDATAALTMAGSKNRVFYGTDTPTSTSPVPSGAGDLYRQLDASADVVMEYQWNGTAWAAQEITSAAISNLDLGKLTAGTAFVSEAVIEKLWAEVIRARKILVDQLLVGSGNNLIVDPYFTNTDVKSYRGNSSSLAGSWGASATYNLNFYGAGGQDTTTTKSFFLNSTSVRDKKEAMIPVTEGEVFRVRAMINSTGGSARFNARVAYKDGTWAFMASGWGKSGYWSGDGQGMVIEDQWTVQPNVTHFMPYITWDTPVTSAHVYGGISCTNMATSSLIVNGAITGDHIEANTVAAKVASVISLNADRITSGVINTNRLNASEIAAAVATIISLNADRITSGTINTDRLNANEIAAAVATVISLNADRITAGTLNTARLNATEVAAAVATVISLNADRITSGVINTARLNAAEIAAATAAFQTVRVENLTASTGSFSTAVIDKLWVDFFATRSITAQYLSIGSSENLVPDSNFETADSSDIWLGQISGPGGGVSSEIVYGSESVSMLLPVFSDVRSNPSLYARYLAPEYRIPVVPGESYRITSWVYLDAASIGNLTSVDQRVYHYTTRDGAILNSRAGETNVPNPPVQTWFEVGGLFTVPAGTYFLTPRVTVYYPGNTAPTPEGARWFVSPPKVVRASGGELIVDGAITARTIAAQSISVDKLSIGDFTNMAPSPAEQPAAWEFSGVGTISTTGLTPVGKRLHFNTSNTSAFAWGPYTACKAGDQFFLSGMLYRASGVTGGVYLRCYWYKADKTAASTAYTHVSGGTETDYPSGALLAGSATAPADAVYARWGVGIVAHTGDIGIYDMTGRRMSGGELIVNGAVTASKIDADAVTATHIAANAVQAEHIDAEAITSEKIKVGALDGKVITGATVQTSSTTTGVVMDASGIEAQVSGTRRFFLNATTGEIEAIGAISTGPSTGARAELKQLSNAGVLDFYTEAGTNVPHGSLLTFDTSSVALRRYTDATSFSQYLSLESAATRLNHNSNLRLEMSSTGATLYGNSSSYLRVAIAGSSATLYLRANGSDYFVLGPQSGLGNVVTSVPLYNTTTTAAANMSISVNGVLMRSTSASKYKLYPRTLADDVGEKLLTLEAKDWIDASDSRMVAEAMTPQTASEAADPETELPPLPECRRIPGVIAEEVAAAGLEEFVIYGEDGEIEGVMYDRLGVALIPVVKRQRDRIEALEEEQALMLDRLAQLEAAIAAMNPQP